MANTYTQINVQAVFSVKGRENFLGSGFREKLFEYISGILKGVGQFPLAVNGDRDHVHIFFELNPSTSVADVMEKVKANSSKWINENHFVAGRFEWQKGYGAFTYSRSQRDSVINYIANQEQHHQRRSFRKEYLDLLQKFEVEFDERYVFEFYE
jgi:REP element-mobilizing transposase RayT